MSTPPAKLPEILDKIVDVVLVYKPKPKMAIAKKKKRSKPKKRASQ